MLRVVLVLFAYVLVLRGVGGSRYGDYSAAGMPHYNMEYENRVPAPIDEYPDRSPDAPAHLDYKYEEETRDTVKSFPVKHLDDEVWQKPNAKGRKAMKVTDSDESEIENTDDMVPKYKSSRRFTKHRTRIKGDRVVRPSGRRMNYDPSRNADIDLYERNDFDVGKEPSHKGNRDSHNFEFRDITPKASRRKPRDRTIRPEKEAKYESDNDEDISNVGDTDDEFEEIDIRNHNRPLKKKEKFRPALSVVKIDKMKPKSYQEYDEYEGVDMKRINKLKKRLPDLFRRTQASDPEPTSTRGLQELSYRRTNPPDAKSTTRKSTKTPTPKTTINVIRLVSRTSKSTVTSKPIQASTQTNSSGLSIAEKSRLSILKKAQRKERERNTTTTKPPVLLQVTQRLQTVVMVEPQQKDLQLRARQIWEDSPERIERAKKLMRHKLLASAKSIHELADNWDDVICDYIDVTLLDNRATPEATTIRVVSVAERELKAVLGHRQRKDIQATLPTNFLPTTFPPHAVDPLMDDQWNSFIVSNNTQRLQYPLYITIVALINYLQYYRSKFYSTSISKINKGDIGINGKNM